MAYILLQNGRIKPFFCNFAAKILMFNLYNYQHEEKVYWVMPVEPYDGFAKQRVRSGGERL
ncbi:MAG: hypothetical protein K6D55_05465 [Prevotella sp.]|nr:hypothetical protein [Prevotella sp.]